MTAFASTGRRGAAWAVSAAVVSAGLASMFFRPRRLPQGAPAVRRGSTPKPQRADAVGALRGAMTDIPGLDPVVDATDLGPAEVDATEPPRAVPAELGAGRFPRARWLTLYATALFGPFVLVLAMAPTPPRPFMFELGSALGISALSLLALQLVLPARLKLFAPLGADVAIRLHRHLADVLISVIAAHIAVVMLADPRRVALLDFLGAPWRAQAAVASVAVILALAMTSIIRRRVRLPYALWRGIHVVLAVGALLLAVIHTIGVGRYLVHGAPIIALAALTAAGLGATIVLRVARFRRRSVKPYTVRRVVRERGGATTLELAADGHAGQAFAPGQFAWLKLPGARSSLAEHPFSYSSSALDPDRPSFTIQPYGGFSKEVSAFKPGAQLLVDGPHGGFRLRPEAAGSVLISGGIGITPSMSILLTAAEQHDPRPFVLVYSVKSPERIVFSDELEQLQTRLDLTVLYVVSTPVAGWTGAQGRISRDLLDAWLPADLRDWQFLACGPPAFVDASVGALVELDVPVDRVHAERFIGV